jgi:glycosyltransferase involved in cell wall biosynthesis
MKQQHRNLCYALITPARNEEKFIDATIRSVVAQTVRPVAWIIVSDGSTDATDAIVERHAKEHSWISLLRMPETRDRTFAAKATAFNAAYARLAASRFDIVGNLDADITLPEDYFDFLLARFEESEKLGVAGTPFVEDVTQPGDHSYSHKFADLTHVSGACQMFRRKCFEEIGGYVPIKGGGIDWVAVTTARMKGWETRTFVERSSHHHRKMGTATRGPVMARFRHGQEDYYMGGHPLWQVFRGVFQMRLKPYVLGGLFLILGYFYAMAIRMPRPIPKEVIAFRRAEQIARLRKLVGG